MHHSQEQEVDDQGNEVILSLERKSVQNFRDQDEYLYAMKEDLAEWFNVLYGTNINVENFMEEIETGVLICIHANKTQEFILDVLASGDLPPDLKHVASFTNEKPVTYRASVRAGTFQARDNISNFIAWCRGALELPDSVLFETEDLVSRKNERHVVLCLLEVARRGARYGMEAPQIIQLEQEIDAEIREEQEEEEIEEYVPPPRKVIPPKPRERWVNDLMSLDEMVSTLYRHFVSPYGTVIGSICMR